MVGRRRSLLFSARSCRGRRAVSRFARQVAIPGWDQARVSSAAVAVVGRGWPGAFLVWALGCMGVGDIIWVGAPSQDADLFGRWLLAVPCPFQGCRIWDYPFDVDRGPEWEWALNGAPLNAVVCCEENRTAQAKCRAFTPRRSSFLAVTAADGGWVGSSVAPGAAPKGQPPVTSMLLASVLADAVRELLIPLSGGGGVAGSIGLTTPEHIPAGSCVVVGVGGVGVYAATLAAASGCRVVLVDMDQVESSNLNRQGLFTAEDASDRRYKAEAARDALTRLFPRTRIESVVHRVDAGSLDMLRRNNPSVILSAVDNAAARLALSGLGRQLDVPVIQGGTDVFAADCFTQERGGSPLDEQMRGALSAADAREISPRTAGCAVDPSYVVPGMVAGALMTHRLFQACELYRGLQPIRWRAGCLPVEQRSLRNDFKFDSVVA
jgi:tRNA A37 threonylcarbamoyladenosine dehydratase